MATIASISSALGAVGEGLVNRSAQDLKQIKNLGVEMQRSKDALTAALAKGSDPGAVEALKMKFEEKSALFKMQLSVSDVINRLIDQIIDRIAQIGR